MSFPDQVHLPATSLSTPTVENKKGTNVSETHHSSSPHHHHPPTHNPPLTKTFPPASVKGRWITSHTYLLHIQPSRFNPLHTFQCRQTPSDFSDRHRLLLLLTPSKPFIGPLRLRPRPVLTSFGPTASALVGSPLRWFKVPNQTVKSLTWPPYYVIRVSYYQLFPISR
jgi:hypothetical protein